MSEQHLQESVAYDQWSCYECGADWPRAHRARCHGVYEPPTCGTAMVKAASHPRVDQGEAVGSGDKGHHVRTGKPDTPTTEGAPMRSAL